MKKIKRSLAIIVVFVFLLAQTPLQALGTAAFAPDNPVIFSSGVTIIFEAGDGTGTMPDEQVPVGEIYMLPVNGFTAPMGYKFYSWFVTGYADPIGTMSPGDFITVGMWPDTIVTVTAQWIAESGEYPVTFNPGYGTGTMANEMVVYGDVFILPANEFTAPEGYIFHGWWISGYADPLGTVNVGEGIIVEGPVTALALWMPIEIVKEASWVRQGALLAGDTITYTITVVNLSGITPLNIYSLVVVDTLDSRLTFVPGSVQATVYNSDNSWSVADVVYSYENRVLRVTIQENELPVGSYIAITFDATVAPNAAGQTIKNTAILEDTEGNSVVDATYTVYVARGSGGSGSGRPGSGGGGDTNQPPTQPPYPPGVFTADHIAYLIGFPDGTVRPNNTITRAEVATIIFRLFDDSYRTQIWRQSNPFSDVVSANWFNNAVSTLTNADILEGFPDGTFRGNQAITRAEFVTMVARFLEDTSYTGSDRFNDISGHWAREYINVVGQYDWIVGFAGGDFRPNQSITRAEAAAIINRMLERLPETSADLLPGMMTWSDNMNTNAWFYLYIQEATNSHDYEMKADGVHETWTELREPRDWTVLERPNSRPQDIL